MEQITVKDLVEATGGRLLSGNPEIPVKNISLDSRVMKGEDLFVPLIGEKVNAHKFIPMVFGNGAVATLTSEHDEMESPYAYIRVEDTKAALQDIGRYCRKRLCLPLVGVTGSVGKTTTREMIAAALSAKFRVFKTPGNSNSQVGVPITISEISAEDQVGVIELGMSEPGELTIIAKIAQIDMAVITNIGITHIEYLGSRENIYREKMTIQDGLKDGGVLILNGDDDMLCDTKGREGVTTLYYGVGENCDFRAEEIVLTEDRTEFTAVYKNERQKIRLQVLGKHHVSNAMAAVAVCCLCGMTLKEASAGLAGFTGFKNRQQIYKGRRLTILDDSYNASPVSMEAALDVFMTLRKEGRHVAVLADMKELGEDVLKYHHEVGVYAAKAGVDYLVTLGEACQSLCDGFREHSGAPVAEFLEKEQMLEFLKKELREGDCVLFKGSNSMGISVLAAHFIREDAI